MLSTGCRDDAAETGLLAPDPLNLIRIMPAEGLWADILTGMSIPPSGGPLEER
jgi:hypothetical protein